MNEQIEKGYLELPNFKVDYQELIDEVKDIDSRNAWLENPANPDQIGSKDPYADYIQPVIPQTIKQNFKEIKFRTHDKRVVHIRGMNGLRYKIEEE